MTTRKQPRRTGSIREKSKGYWELSAEGPVDPRTGRRRRKWSTVRGTRRDAERALAVLIADLATGKVVVASDTVAQALDDWWKVMRAHRWSDATSIRHRQDLDVHILPALGRTKLADLHARDLNRLYSTMTEAGASPRTVQHVHNTIRAALRYAVTQGLITRNPADAAIVPRRRHVVRQLPTAHQLAHALDFAAGDSQLWGTYLRLACYTGARPAELCALRWEDVDLERARITIDEAIGRKLHTDGTITWQLKGTKTQSERRTGVRTVAIDLTTSTTLRRWRNATIERTLAAGITLQPTWFVFPADTFGERPLTPATPSRRWQRYAREAGIDPTIRLYDAARHHHVSWCLAMGVPVAEVAARVGNTPETIYSRYSHVLAGNERRVADLIDQHQPPTVTIREAGS